MSPLFISLLMAAGFAAFGVMAWRKLAIVAALAPDNRFDRLGERTLRLLKMGIGQSRMLTGDFRPELMHAGIFVCFMTLLWRRRGIGPLFTRDIFYYSLRYWLESSTRLTRRGGGS